MESNDDSEFFKVEEINNLRTVNYWNLIFILYL